MKKNNSTKTAKKLKTPVKSKKTLSSKKQGTVINKDLALSKEEEKALQDLIDETLDSALQDEQLRQELVGDSTHLAVDSAHEEHGCCSDDEHEQSEHDESAHADFTPSMTQEEYMDLLNQVIDPETALGIVDMGLIYDVKEEQDGIIIVTMTLTSMGCPAGPQLTTDIDGILRLQNHVKDVQINIVWEPAWSPDRMNPKVREMLWGY